MQTIHQPCIWLLVHSVPTSGFYFGQTTLNQTSCACRSVSVQKCPGSIRCLPDVSVCWLPMIDHLDEVICILGKPYSRYIGGQHAVVVLNLRSW